MKLGGTVDWDYQSNASDDLVKTQDVQPPEPGWLRGMLGDDFFKSVTHLNLSGSQVADAGLGHLKALPELRALYLSSTNVTDAGLESL